MGSHPRNIWIDNDLWDQAAELASATGVSRGRIVNTALSLYLTSSTSTNVQMEVTAVGPTHRKPAEPMTVSNVDTDG